MERDFGQAVSRGGISASHTELEMKRGRGRGAPTRLLGGARPRPTLKVVLEARQGPSLDEAGAWHSSGSTSLGIVGGLTAGPGGAAAGRQARGEVRSQLSAQLSPSQPCDVLLYPKPTRPICLLPEASSPPNAQDSPATGANAGTPEPHDPQLHFPKHWLCQASTVCAQLMQPGGVHVSQS